MSVYMKAAKRVACGDEFSCVAVRRVCERLRIPTHIKIENYKHIFCPSLSIGDCEPWGDEWGKTPGERKQCRVLALLFMHWISEDSA